MHGAAIQHPRALAFRLAKFAVGFERVENGIEKLAQAGTNAALPGERFPLRARTCVQENGAGCRLAIDQTAVGIVQLKNGALAAGQADIFKRFRDGGNAAARPAGGCNRGSGG